MDVSQVENSKRRTSPNLNVVSCLCSDHVPRPAHSIRFQKQDGYMTGPPVHGARQHPAADSRLALPTPQSARSKIEQASMFSNSTDPNTRLCPKWSLHPLQRGTTPCVQKLKPKTMDKTMIPCRSNGSTVQNVSTYNPANFFSAQLTI